MAVAFTALALAFFQQRAMVSCDADRSVALYEQGYRALKQSLFSSAAQLLGDARRACPRDDRILLPLAEAQIGMRDFASAVATAREYLDENQYSIPARVLIAQGLLLWQKIADANKEADEILERTPANAAALKIKANCAYLLGDFATAKSSLIRALDANPEDQDAAYMLGRMYYQEGYLELAVGQFRRVLRENPAAYKAWDNLGLCYQALGDPETAVRHFLTAIKLVEKDHREYDWAYANLAELLLETGKPQKAYDAAAIAADRNPNSARNFYIGGKALEELGKTQLAVNWMQRSAALDPSYPEPWYRLSLLYSRLGDQAKAQEARATFEQLKAKAPRKRR
jgi:tetratricopeptide (TPR) repeat protein